jgi:hypothetical protein
MHMSSKKSNDAVHESRFPQDFMFQLTRAEYATLRLQLATLERGRGQHSKYLPFAFTEHGVAMLSSVLRSRRAVMVNIEIMRTFSRFREALLAHKELARQLDALESKYDRQFKIVFDALRRLVTEPELDRRPIGFTSSVRSSRRFPHGACNRCTVRAADGATR